MNTYLLCDTRPTFWVYTPPDWKVYVLKTSWLTLDLYVPKTTWSRRTLVRGYIWFPADISFISPMLCFSELSFLVLIELRVSFSVSCLWSGFYCIYNLNRLFVWWYFYEVLRLIFVRTLLSFLSLRVVSRSFIFLISIFYL